MVDYKWQLYPSSGELFTDANAVYGKSLSESGLLVDNDNANTTDYIYIGADFTQIKVAYEDRIGLEAPVIAFYKANKNVCLGVSSGNNKVYTIPSSCQYIRFSANNKYWSEFSVIARGISYTPIPIYKDDLAIKYDKESGSQFLRRSLDGSLTFLGADYDKIMSYNYDTYVHIILLKAVNGGVFTDYWEGEFTRSKCAITFEDKKIVVTPEVTDVYTGLFAKMEDEHNLIDLAPEIEHATYYQRPLLQLYVWATGVVTNIVGGANWEAEVDDPQHESSMRTLGFSQMQANILQFSIAGAGDVDGYYSGTAPLSLSFTTTETIISTFYAAKGNGSIVMSAYYDGYSSYTIIYRIYDESGLMSTLIGVSGNRYEHNIVDRDNDFTIDGVVFANISQTKIYSRYLCNVDNAQTEKLEYNDPFVDTTNNNYGYRIKNQETSFNIVDISTRFLPYPTKYGRVSSAVENVMGRGKLYYNTPLDDIIYAPVAQSKWGAVSLWIWIANTYDADIDAAYRNAVELKDVYPLWSVIDTLAKKADARLSFKADVQHSKFLYDNINPVTKQGNEYQHLCITQLSNISRGEYTQAAQKGEISLKQVFDMLKNVFKCFWWVDDNYQIHIEHISYFMSGGTYDEGASYEVGIDLTRLINPRNNLRMDFALGECKYQFDESATRYEFEWSIGATKLFNGNAIEIIKRGIDSGKKEEVSISNFVADIDYIVGNPGDVGNDGWALLATQKTTQYDEVLYTIVGDVVFEGGIYYVQNRALAFPYLQEKLLAYNMSGSRLIVNGHQTEAKSLERALEQQVTIPYGDSEPNDAKAVKTFINVGVIKSIVFTLSSRSAKITLRYPMY